MFDGTPDLIRPLYRLLALLALDLKSDKMRLKIRFYVKVRRKGRIGLLLEDY